MQRNIRYIGESIMSVIQEVQITEQERWDKLVRSLKDYDVFYLHAYVQAFMQEKEKNGEPVLLWYENGADRAVNVVFKRDVSKDEKMAGKIPPNQYFDLVTPYGYGGFWGVVADYDALNRAYHEYCCEKKYVCEFVRFELFSEYRRNYGGQAETRTHNVVRSLALAEEELWMDFKQKVRKNVKRAKKNGLRVIWEDTEEHLPEFLDIYYGTMERSDAEKDYYFSKNFFETLGRMKENRMYFYVVYEEKIISAELVLYGSENAYSYLGGTDQGYFDLRPNDFLKYEIIKWAKEKGLKNFVLGGGYGTDDGIFQYKTSFAPDGVVDFYTGKKIFDEDAYQYLLKLREKENPMCRESLYFPQYRA